MLCDLNLGVPSSLPKGVDRDNEKETGNYYLGFRVQDSGFRVQDLGFRVQDLGFRVQDLGFRA